MFWFAGGNRCLFSSLISYFLRSVWLLHLMWLFLSQVYFIYLFFSWSVYLTDSCGSYPLSSSLYNIPLRTFYSAGLVVMNCSVFSFKYPISLSFLTDNPAGYRIFGSQVFVFWFVCCFVPWNILFCVLLSFIVPCEVCELMLVSCCL